MDPAVTPAPIWLPFAILGGFLVLFPLIWCGVVFLISRIAGWQHLAERFPAGDRPIVGDRRAGVQGIVGAASYRGTLTITFCEDGFFVEVMRLFRIGHPSLFIPWSAVTARESINVLWIKAVRLRIGNPPAGVITLPESLMERHHASV